MLGRKNRKSDASRYASTTKINFQKCDVFASIDFFNKAFVAQQRTCRHYDLVSIFERLAHGNYAVSHMRKAANKLDLFFCQRHKLTVLG